MSPRRLFPLLLLMAGCMQLGPSAGPVPERYVLPVPEGSAGPAGSAPDALVLERPEVAPGLATDRIAVLRAGRRLDHLAGARWAVPLPELLQAFFRASLAQDFPATAVTAAPGGNGGPRLAAMVWHFQAEYPDGTDRPPRLRVALSLRLEPAGGGPALARQRAEGAVRAAANRRGAIAAGLAELLAETFTRARSGLLAQWRGARGAGLSPRPRSPAGYGLGPWPGTGTGRPGS